MQGALAQADAGVAIILEALDESGLAGNTIFLFTVDHGIPFPRAKGTLYDPGIEIAGIFRWPQGPVAAGRTCGALVSNVDCLSTLLELMGVDVPQNVQGRSFAPALAGGADFAGREAVFAMFQDGGAHVTRCCRTQRYKLIRSFAPTRRLEVPVDLGQPVRRQTCPAVELFDLEADPCEFRDVAADRTYRAALEEMDGRLRSWMQEVADPLLSGPMVTPYYREATAAWTARDAGA